jgi:UDP-N-acetyl-D-mannosaminuronic acid transferase (WecB/TagA/CpsF family)
MRWDCMAETVRLLGLDFTSLDAAGAASLIAARPASACFGYVVTPNADHLVRISRQPDLRPLYEGATLCLLDSRVVQRAARAFGLRGPRVAAGSDVVPLLLRHHLMPGERVTIIGLRPAHLPSLIAATGMAPPAHYDPPMGFERDPAMFARAVQFVLDHPARIVLIAVGSPRQEILAAAIAATGRATGTGLCIGASLNFIAGVESRAPRWVQHAGLEWAHRLSRSPRRMARRYVLNSPQVFAMLLQERLRRAG